MELPVEFPRLVLRSTRVLIFSVRVHSTSLPAFKSLLNLVRSRHPTYAREGGESFETRSRARRQPSSPDA